MKKLATWVLAFVFVLSFALPQYSVRSILRTLTGQ